MKKINLLSMFLFGIMSLNSVLAQERVITRGVEVSTNGYMPEVGVMAPDFSATDKGMNEVSLSSFKGKKVILNIFPSLDTPTCALSVRHFNAEAASFENTVVLCISKIYLLLNQDSALQRDWIGLYLYLFSVVRILKRIMVWL